MKNKRYEVVGNSWYIQTYGYSGQTGLSKYKTVKESLNATGFEVTLIFNNGKSDGFWLRELKEVSE